MNKKHSFAKLTEDLEKIDENISKSEEESKVIKPEETAHSVEELENVKPAAEPEPELEADPDPKSESEKNEDEKEEEKVEDEAKEEKEEVEKSKKDCEDVVMKDEKGKDRAKDKKSKKDDKAEEEEEDDEEAEEKEDKDMKADKAKDKGKKDKKESVKKSNESDLTEKDVIGAFEAVVKSYSNIKAEQANVGSRLEAIEKSIAKILEMVSPKQEATESEEVKEEVSKNVEAEPEAKEEPKAEPELEPEGKAVEFVAKSEDGIPVAKVGDGAEEENPESEAPKEEEFNAADHIKAATDYFFKNAHNMTVGEQAAFRQAVARVKRGAGNEADIALFRTIVAENSKN